MTTRARLGTDVETLTHTYMCGKFIMIRGNRVNALARAHHKVCSTCKNFKPPNFTRTLAPGATQVVGNLPEHDKGYRKICMDECDLENLYVEAI